MDDRDPALPAAAGPATVDQSPSAQTPSAGSPSQQTDRGTSGRTPRTMSQILDLTGTTIGGGRYQVSSKLGEGSMGLVYRAYDNRLETEVVIKIPTSATLSDPEFAERFNREIRSLVKLSHPHIVGILDVGDHSGVPFVVMQFLSGGSLRDRIVDDHGHQRPQTLDSLQTWVMSIAKALDFIHDQQFLHRDVKPANILFDQHGNAFLSDFGLAKALQTADEQTPKRDVSLTAAGFLVGTPNYVAPELIMGHAHDGRLDQYSLAMTVYEALAGCVPVEGPTASATMVNQTSMKIPPVTQYVTTVPESVSDAILRGLSKNQKKRFDNCVQFAEAVLNALPGAAKPAPGASTSGKVSRGSDGRIPCPQCGKVLPLKPQFAGKRARCAGCMSLLLIGNDLRTLKWLAGPPAETEDREAVAAPAPGRPRQSQRMARDTVRNQNSSTRRNPRLASDAEVEELLGEEVFGVTLNRNVALAVVGVLAGVLVIAALVIGFVLERNATKQDRDAAKVNKMSRPEQ